VLRSRGGVDRARNQNLSWILNPFSDDPGSIRCGEVHEPYSTLALVVHHGSVADVDRHSFKLRDKVPRREREDSR
jgi:hypothetical protein